MRRRRSLLGWPLGPLLLCGLGLGRGPGGALWRAEEALLASDAPVGTCVLATDGLPSNASLSTRPASAASHFALGPHCLLTAKPLASLPSDSSPVEISLRFTDSGRLVRSLFLRVLPNSQILRLSPATPQRWGLVKGTERLSTSQPIEAFVGGNRSVRFRLWPASPADSFLSLRSSFDPISGAYSPTAETTRPLRDSDLGSWELRLQAFVPDQPWNRKELPLRLSVTAPQRPPRFLARDYWSTVKRSESRGETLVRVQARSQIPGASVTYSLVRSSATASLHVDPLTGDVFSAALLPLGSLDLRARAEDSHGNGATVAVRLRVTDDSALRRADSAAKPPKPSGRFRRDVRTELRFQLREDFPMARLLPRSVFLGAFERVKDAPVVKEDLTVHANGSVELTQPLNYEAKPTVDALVIVENTQTLEDSAQRVWVGVEDVEERPAFLNAPLPYEAVVPLEAPLGFSVFQFQARDEAGDGDSEVEYRLLSTEPPDAFSVDPRSGRVKTAQTTFHPGRKYLVYVQARDLSSSDPALRDSDVAILDVRGGTRPPQFFQQRYAAAVPEDTAVHTSLLRVEARSFRNRLDESIRFSLEDERGEPPKDFSVDERSGVVRLAQSLDFDDPLRPKTYDLRVVAREGSLVSQTALRLAVLDVNDNDPVFSQPLYSTSLPEDHPAGQPILSVSARDPDGGLNGRITYAISDGNFSVSDEGVVSARRRLDADQNRLGFHIYKVRVTARDGGSPARSATSTLHIRTENVNDEPPFFQPTSQYTAYVAENAEGNTPVLTVQAVDPDKDQVSYSFRTASQPFTQETSFFTMDKDTGLVQLRPGVKAAELAQSDVYNLTLVASDDGSCCPGGAASPHQSLATLIIGIADVNNNKPVFHDCARYSAVAEVPEGKHENFSVVRVEAKDEDSQQNGLIEYSLYYPKGEARRAFHIEPASGLLSASPYVEFDREERPFEDVTVKATDKGDRPLIGFCHFTVRVRDANDNAPQFDRASYETSVSRSTSVGHSVLTVFADDRDGPDNARISYRLLADPLAQGHEDDLKYFSISEDSGEITLVSQLPASRETLRFLVEAADGGRPEPQRQKVDVVLKLRSSATAAPRWASDALNCPPLKRVAENAQINSIFFRCYASSPADPSAPISYSMANGAKPGTNSQDHFRAFTAKRNGDFEVIVRNMHQLDFEATRSYNLTITATDLRSGVSTDKFVRVELEDRNDQVPKFTLDKFIGQVREEEAPRADSEPVAQVMALDSDEPGTPAAAVTYSILQNGHEPSFRIDRHSGKIFALRKFDRETTDSFILAVEAQDGRKSDLPGSTGPNSDITKVQIFVEDINDNSPFFNKTRELGKVRESAEMGQNVMTVKAHDADRETSLKYSLLPNGERSPFGVRANSGTIFVKEPLDFEQRQNYSLTLRVTDGKHDATTKLFIEVLDVNDNAPVFEQSLYTASMEEEFVPSQALLRVEAKDADRGAGSGGGGIVYRLEGQGAEEFFAIHPSSGHIRVLKPLDRDPPLGAAKWSFVVQAIDDGGQGLIGYADVQVTLSDVNDNAPRFEGGPFQGFVEENSVPKDARGVYVMRMRGADYDDPASPNARLSYRIQRNKQIGPSPVFDVEAETGKIFALLPLDRENASQRHFDIQLQVEDAGRPPLSGTATVRITVLDLNDNPPTFPRPLYSATVDETAPPQTAVLTVSASDPDDEATENVLHYTLKADPERPLGAEFFYVSTDADSSGSNVGVLRVKKPLDFEDAAQRDGFSVLVECTDGRFSATTRAELRLIDANDNAPRVEGPGRVEVSEAAAVGTALAGFTATDPDLGGKDALTFRINRTTDGERQFTISRTGQLSIAKPLDREMIPNYRLRIEAEDSQGNVGSNILQVYLQDVNDNAPSLFTTRPAVVWEHAQAPQFVAEVFGKDPDTPANGPPFRMAQVKDGPNWDSFAMAFWQGGDGGKGVMNVTTKVEFDREGPAGKVIQLPISISDNGQPSQTQIRYLDIIIGDINDSPMYDGRKTITVYNYRGQMPASAIGSVYVEDADDWDRGDKTFQWAAGSAPPNFALLDDGVIQMEAGVTHGEYTLEFTVTDATKVPVEKAKGTVVVKVVEVPEEAFLSSGSLRLRGLTAADFITKVDGTSPYDLYRRQLSLRLNVPEDNVHIFSLMDKGGAPPILDVRYSAHNSPYKPSIGLDGVVASHKAEFENLVAGVSILQTRIDECVWETCDLGCHTELEAKSRPTLVNSNETAVLGVTTTTERRCSCPEVSVPSACAAQPCLNQGICHETYPGFFCECRGPYKGPMCEGTVRSFDGSGWAWFPPVPACMESHISLDFITRQANAILLYNGPMFEKASQYEQSSGDYLVVEIRNRKLQVRLSLGAAEETLIAIDKGADVDDGEWHTVDIIRVKQEVEVMLDKCRTAVVQSTPGGVYLDTSGCSKTQRTAKDFEQLNLNTPLQLGGVAPSEGYAYPRLPSVAHLDGCIRNLNVNQKLYDLAAPGLAAGSTAGCKQTQSQCDSNSLDGPGYCVHGACAASYHSRKCDCDPGWSGPRCDRRMRWQTFGQQSFINYAFGQGAKLPSRQTDIKILFAADTDSGTLAKGQNLQGTEYVSPSIVNRRVVFESQLGSGNKELRLPIELARNQSYWLHVQRVNEWSRISLDGLPGRFTAESRGEKVGQELDLSYDRNAFFLGASSANPGQLEDFRGCVADFRWDDYWMPLNNSYDAEEVPYVSLANSQGVTDGCPFLPTCASKPGLCQAPFVCFDFWKGPFCTCPEGMSVVTREGRLVGCGESSAYLRLGLSNSAVAAILVSLLALIVLVLFLVVYSKRRRPGPTPFHPADDIRENIINYREEGGGEEDQDTYNIAPLRKPVLPTNGLGGGLPVGPGPSPGQVGDFIRARKAEADGDPSAPPFDELRLYADEGEGLSPAGSLSSLESLPDHLDLADASRLGPRFANIADLYSQ